MAVRDFALPQTTDQRRRDRARRLQLMRAAAPRLMRWQRRVCVAALAIFFLSMGVRSSIEDGDWSTVLSQSPRTGAWIAIERDCGMGAVNCPDHYTDPVTAVWHGWAAAGELGAFGLFFVGLALGAWAEAKARR
jgi:hypothetical protein